MHNNLIYVNDGRGKIDASLISEAEWAWIVQNNRDSIHRQLVKCAWCWDEDRVTHWMRTYTRGTRVVSHQPGEVADHPYQALETDEHKAYCDRVERVGVEEGFEAQREARASDGRTRSDVLLLGNRHVSYEMQHSPFKAGHGAKERTKRSLAAKRDAVAWHTDSQLIAERATAAMLRSNQARLPQIENPRYVIRILGGYRKVVPWTCTAREGHRCPQRRFAGCGDTHVRTEPTGISLDEFIRQAPAGLVMPVLPLDRLGFWTTLQDFRIWSDHHDETGRPRRGRARLRPGTQPLAEGHSRNFAAEDHRPAEARELTSVSQGALELPPQIIALQRSAEQARKKLADLEGVERAAQWATWRTAAEAFQAATTDYAARAGISRYEVEQAAKRAVRQPDPRTGNAEAPPQ